MTPAQFEFLQGAAVAWTMLLAAIFLALVAIGILIAAKGGR